MFRFTSQALILSRSKDDDVANIEVSLGSNRNGGASETISIPLPPAWSGVKTTCADILRLVVAATGIDPANLALVKDQSAVMPFEEIVTKRGSYRVVKLGTYPTTSKSSLFHCAVLAFQASSSLFLSANTSVTGLGVSRFNLDPSCVFALFGSASDGCIVQSYSTGQYVTITRDHDAWTDTKRWVLGLGSRATVIKMSLATGEVVFASGADAFTMSVNDFTVCLQKGTLLASTGAAVPDAANAGSGRKSKSGLGFLQRKSKSLPVGRANGSADNLPAAKPFCFLPVHPSRFNLFLSSAKDLAWFYTNSRVRFRYDTSDAFVLLHDFPINDTKRGIVRSSPEVMQTKGCEVRRIPKGTEVTSIKLVILDENSLKVAFQHRNLMLTWSVTSANAPPSVFWAEGNPHSPQNNNAFYFDFLREGGETKVIIQIKDGFIGSAYALTVRSTTDTTAKANTSAALFASFVPLKDHSGTPLSVAGSEAYADFDLSSVLVPGTTVSLKVVVEHAPHKGANVLLTHRGNDVFCDDRFSDSTSRWTVQATAMKHPTNTNNGAVALRNVFSGLYLQAFSTNLDENGAHLDSPICYVNVVLDPYDELGNFRSACAFTFENNCIRSCDGSALGIEEMSAAELLRTTPCSSVAFMVRGFRGQDVEKRKASFFVEIGGDRLVDTHEVFEPLMDDKMRQLKCLSPLGIGFRRAWQNTSGPGQSENTSRAHTDDCTCLLYSDTPASDGSVVTFPMQSLPSIDESDAAVIGTVTYTMIAMLAYCKKTNTEACIIALSEVFGMDIKRTRKLYDDLASVPSVAHIYNRTLRPEMNPFCKPKAFENENCMLDTKKYQEYRDMELARTRTELLNVVSMLYLSIHIPRYKMAVAPEPPHAAVGLASKIEQRTFWIEAQVDKTHLSSFCFSKQHDYPNNSVGSTCVTLGVLPRSSAGGGGRGGTEAIKLALQAVVPVPSSKVRNLDITIRFIRKTRWGLQKVVAECKAFAADGSQKSLPLNASNVLNQPTCKLDCNGLEALNVHPSGGAAAGTISVCTFDASFALTTGVTGNYFEGQGTPSAWTGHNVDVYVTNHAQSNSKRKISGAVRVNGCRLNFKDKLVEPPILLASSLMQCGWRDTGNQNSLVFTSHNGRQTVKIVNRETDQRDDTWPFFCQSCVTASQMHGEHVESFPLHAQTQINRGKDDLPLFLRVLIVAFVRHENHLMALSSTTSSPRAVQMAAFKTITDAFREFYSVPHVYFHLVYMSVLFNASMNIQMSSIDSIIDLYTDIVSTVSPAKSFNVTPRDVQMTQRVARLLSWRLNTILSSATSIFGKLSYRIIKRLAKSLSLIASQCNQALDLADHEQRTLCDSMSGDVADAVSSILPKSSLTNSSTFASNWLVSLHKFAETDMRLLRDLPKDIAVSRAHAMVVNLKHQLLSYFNFVSKPVAETWSIFAKLIDSLRSLHRDFDISSAPSSACKLGTIDAVVNAAVAVMCLYNHQAVRTGLKHTSLAFDQTNEKEQQAGNEIDKLLGDVCCMTGKSFASLPCHLLADAVHTYIQEIESGVVKVLSKNSLMKKLKRILEICDENDFLMDTEQLTPSEKDLKGWQFSSNSCVGVMTHIEEAFAVISDGKLPSGSFLFQFCEASTLQVLHSISQLHVAFEKNADKFSLEKGLSSGLSGQLEVLKDIGKDGSQALKALVVGDEDESTSDLMGESLRETQDRREMWLRERGNIVLIQCINDCQCLHEMLLRRLESVVGELLPSRVKACLVDLSPADYATTDAFSERLNTVVIEAYERCDYPLPEDLGLNAFESNPPSITVVSHFLRPSLQIESIWHDMCKMLANRIGLGLEDMLNRFLKKVVYRLQPEIGERKDQYEEHCKSFYALLDECMDLGERVVGFNDSKARRDRDVLILNIRDDLIFSFYSNSLIGLTDNMRHAVELRLVQDVYALITQILSNMMHERCRFCVSPPHFGGLAKFFRAILSGFEDLFVGRRAERVLSALPQSWVDQHTAFLKEEISLMALDSTQLIRIANAPPDSMDNKTSFGMNRSQIAASLLLARKSDKKAMQRASDASSKVVSSSELIENALLGRRESKTKPENENGFVAQISTKTYRKGWMVKEGQMNKSWKKRWFVLLGQELQYFEDQSEEHQKGVLKLGSDTQVLPMQRPKTAGISMITQFGADTCTFGIRIVSGGRTLMAAVEKESDRVEWIKCLQACIEKASSNERVVQMANLEETRRTDKLLQKHLFKQDIFAERFQTKYDQETITSEVLNSRLNLPPDTLLKDIFHCTLQVTMEHESSTGAVRRATMGVPGNLYITTRCLAFLPLDGSLKTSNAVMMYGNLHHHKKADFMRLVDSTGASNTGTTDAVIITARNGDSIFLSDFLSMDKMMQKLLTCKIEYDRLSEIEVMSGNRNSLTLYKQRKRNMSHFPAESAFIETFMRGLTLPAAGLEAKSDAFPSPGDIASALHKRFWVSNNDMVRGQLVLSHKWMLFIPSHCPAQVAEDGSSNDIAWRPLAVESPKPNNSAKVFYFKAGPKNESSVQRSPYVVVDQVTKSTKPNKHHLIPSQITSSPHVWSCMSSFAVLEADTGTPSVFHFPCAITVSSGTAENSVSDQALASSFGLPTDVDEVIRQIEQRLK